MGARATNARWFRTPKPDPDPWDFYEPLIGGIVERRRNGRAYLARLKEAGLLPFRSRESIIADLLRAPETPLGRAVRMLETHLRVRRLALGDSPAYAGLSTLRKMLELPPKAWS